MTQKGTPKIGPHLLKKKYMAGSLSISVQAYDKSGVYPVSRKGRSAYFPRKIFVDNRLSKDRAKQQPASEDLDLITRTCPVDI